MKHFNHGTSRETLIDILQEIRIKYAQWGSNDVNLHKELPNWREIIADFEKLFEAHDKILEFGKEDHEFYYNCLRNDYADRI